MLLRVILVRMALHQRSHGQPLGDEPLKQLRLLVLVGALVVFRLGSFIPVPGVNPEALTRMIEQGSGSDV